MATQLGIIVDVSGSMEESVGERRNRRGGEWARANFDLVNDLIKHDVSSNNHVFVLGCGGRNKPVAFDLLNTLKETNTPSVSLKETNTPSVYDHLTLIETLQRILDILEQNGAPRVREWGKMDVLLSVVEENDAKTFLHRFEADEYFLQKFVYECLPEECRELKLTKGDLAFGAMKVAPFLSAGLSAGLMFIPIVGPPLAIAGGIASKIASDKGQEVATEKSVREVVEKGKRLLSNFTCVEIGDGAVMDVHKARRILRGRIKRDDLTDDRVDELMDKIRPAIYGGTPLMATLDHAKRLFALQRFNEYNKLLFILSDGKPTDGESPPIAELKALGVKTVSCYITADSILEPKRLYNQRRDSWNEAADLMFRMSSKITSQMIPRTIFLKRGWKIDIENNETRLFIQVNHPDILDDVCDLARDVVCSQDALSDLLSSVSLDLYINKANEGFEPKEQRGGTCYANAAAAVLHLAMQRIVGREGGYPDFFQLRRELIGEYGEDGANTLEVLEEVCPRYRLHCQEVDILGALKAVTAKRPVLARFRLTDAEWDTFSAFYQRNPQGILSVSELQIRRPTRETLGGHAVVLTSYDSQGLRLMNSWGDSWADGGFFRVSDADVLDLKFVDVYWTIPDLRRTEILAYEQRGAEIAQKMWSRLKGLQQAQYVCPMCHQKSLLQEFSGHMLASTCPKCGGQFRIENPGDDLALNLYLLSLSGPNRLTA